MGKKFRELSQEDRRNILLDLVQIINSYHNGMKFSKLSDAILKLHQELDESAVSPLIRRELRKVLGRTILNGMRWSAVYRVDDLNVACQIINNYYDKGMSEIKIWELRRDICEYIKNNPGCTTENVIDEFLVDLEFIDKMNSDLVNYGQGIEFYKGTSHGTKMRVKEFVLSAIDGIIADLSNKKATSSEPKKVEDEDKRKNLKELSPEEREEIQIKILRMIYSESKITSQGISREYYKRYKTPIKDLTIRNMMNRLKGIRYTPEKDEYYMKDIDEALASVNVRRSYLNICIVSNIELDTDKYNGLKRSIEVDSVKVKVYNLECRNNDSLLFTLLDLISMNGVSIDPDIKSQALEAIKERMKTGKRQFL